MHRIHCAGLWPAWAVVSVPISSASGQFGDQVGQVLAAHQLVVDVRAVDNPHRPVVGVGGQLAQHARIGAIPVPPATSRTGELESRIHMSP